MEKFILWAPRAISVILIIFISLFAFDGFVPGATRLNNSMSLLIGLLPAVILTLALILAWFFKLAGGITFVILGIAMILFFHTPHDEITFLTLSSPVLVVGLLFLLSHFYEKSSSARK